MNQMLWRCCALFLVIGCGLKAGAQQALTWEQVRARFEQRFTARRMAEDYLATYNRLAADDRSIARRRLQLVGSAR